MCPQFMQGLDFLECIALGRIFGQFLEQQLLSLEDFRLLVHRQLAIDTHGHPFLVSLLAGIDLVLCNRSAHLAVRRKDPPSGNRLGLLQFVALLLEDTHQVGVECEPPLQGSGDILLGPHLQVLGFGNIELSVYLPDSRQRAVPFRLVGYQRAVIAYPCGDDVYMVVVRILMKEHQVRLVTISHFVDVDPGGVQQLLFGQFTSGTRNDRMELPVVDVRSPVRHIVQEIEICRRTRLPRQSDHSFQFKVLRFKHLRFSVLRFQPVVFYPCERLGMFQYLGYHNPSISWLQKSPAAPHSVPNRL